MFILTCSDPGRKGERGWAGRSAPTPILSQLWRDKQFYHHGPAKELMTKARLMALGPAILQFQLGSLRAPRKPSLALRQRKEGQKASQQHTGSVPRHRGRPSHSDLGPHAGKCTSAASTSFPSPSSRLPFLPSLGPSDPPWSSLELAPGERDLGLDWQPQSEECLY